jgi:tetratricopeptide (TPR) repeat protein
LLGDAAMQAQDWPAAIAAFQVLVGLNPPDPAGAHYNLASAYFGAGKKAEAKRETLRALEIAPTFEKALQLLLKLNERQPESANAQMDRYLPSKENSIFDRSLEPEARSRNLGVAFKTARERGNCGDPFWLQASGFPCSEAFGRDIKGAALGWY